MSRTGSWATQNFRAVLPLLRASRVESNYGRLQRNGIPTMAAAKLGSGYWSHPGLQFFCNNSSSTSTESNGVENLKDEPPVPSSPSFFNFHNWLRWVLGSVLSLLLPFWKHNWQKLQRIEEEAEIVVEEVEKVAEVVEKVAIVAERVSEDIAENLPENSKLKKAALVVETVSKQAAHDAHVTEKFIHTVDEVKNDLDDLESFVEPIIDKIAKKNSQKK